MTTRVLALMKDVARLDPAERKSLLERIQALQGVGGAKSVSASPTTATSELYDAIAAALVSLSGAKPMPLIALKKSSQWQSFAKASEVVEDFVETLEKDRIKKVAVRRWIARLTIEYLMEHNTELRWNNISASLAEVSHTVDYYFPGYMASGLMGLVLNTVYKGTKRKPAFNSSAFQRRNK